MALSPRARRIIKYLATFFLLAFLISLIVRLYNFANLFQFFRPHSGIKASQQEVLDAWHDQSSSNAPTSPELVIPKILHQVFHNWTDPSSTVVDLPEDWERARQSCIDWNPDWEYKLWTAKKSRAFIEEEFPWFLDTYDGYKYPVQRVDVIRYFALSVFGGIYIDLDNGCLQSLEPIRQYPAFTTDGGHGTLSNNIIGGQPSHPFFILLTESLQSYNWPWLLPYIVVSYTSGQWFVTSIWERYHSLLRPGGTLKGFGSGWGKLTHILMDTRPGEPDPFVFWNQEHGGSWDTWDNAWFGWIGSHIGLVIKEVIGAIVVLILLIVGCVYGCLWCGKRRRERGYRKVATEDVELSRLEA
ncbi:nucleotide-diphospho-sugar transferase [Xylariaceae sp. FL1272]|nr:nucleotide-diphospho-sugar transferase [Xylariaceae sp. FL1272]